MFSSPHLFSAEPLLEPILIVILGVAVVSTVAWLVSRRLANNAALRHQILLTALGCCVAAPALVWTVNASELALISIPIRSVEQATPAQSLGKVDANQAMAPWPESSEQPAHVELGPHTPQVDPPTEESHEIAPAENLARTTTVPPEPNQRPAETSVSVSRKPPSLGAVAVSIWLVLCYR